MRNLSTTIKCIRNFVDIPGPKAWPVLGHLHLFNPSLGGKYSFEKMDNAWKDLHNLYGPIVHLRLGTNIVSTIDADDVKIIFQNQGGYPTRPPFGALQKYRKERKQAPGLVTGVGPEWAKLRSSINWLMKSDEIRENFFEDQKQVAEDFVKRVRLLRNSKMIFDSDFLPQLYLFAQEAVGSVVFGKRLGTLEGSKEGLQVIDCVNGYLQSLSDSLLGFPAWKFYKNEVYTRLETSLDFFHQLCKKYFNENQNSHFIKRLLAIEGITEKEILLIMEEIFTGGIDATGNALGFLLVHLAKNQTVQEKLHKEITNALTADTILGKNFDKMPFMTACIKESFRISPTAGGNARIVDSDIILSGYNIPAGTICIGCNPLIGANESYFGKDAFSFRPERWLSQNLVGKPENKIHPFAVLPFGHGSRRCVGQRLAIQEMKLCISLLVKNFKITLCGDENIGTKSRMQLMPDKPLIFKFVDR